MRRVFLSFPVAEKLSNQFLHFADAHQHLTGFRWTRENNFHITLFFIGEVEERNIPEISVRLKRLLSNQTPFDLHFDHFEIKKGKGSHGIFWARFHKRDEFSALARKVQDVVKEFMTIRIQHPDPIPHITLARVKFSGTEPALTNPPLPETQRIDHAELWQTVQTNEGVRYDSLCRFDFITA